MSSSAGLLNGTKLFSPMMLSSAFINLLSLALPFTMLQIYDRILPNQSHGTATVLVIGVAIAILLELFLRFARSWMLASSAANFELSTTINVVNKLLSADYKHVQKIGVGKVNNGLSSIAAMRDLYSGQAAVAIMDFPFVLIFLGLVAYIGGALVFIPIVVWAIVIIFVVMISKKLSAVTMQLSLSEGERSKLLIQVLSGLTTAKALALESHLSDQYRKLNHNRLELQQEVDWLSSKLQEFIQGASQGTTLVLVMLGCLAVLDGQLTTGGLAACSILAGRAVAPLSAIINLRSRLVSAKTAMKQVDSLLQLPEENFNGTTTYKQKLPLGPIEFNNVSSQQVGGKICHLTGAIAAGQIAVIQSNPLTHASLLLSSIGAFNNIDDGTISIDKVQLNDHDSNEFRQSVVYLAPWPTLFAGTVIENMTLFQPQYESFAMELSEALGLTPTLAQLPGGYQTFLGENDSQMLNKGAIKLIAIVRAMVQSPSILLLDEPLISLDADAQARLVNILQSYKGKMTIVVASYFDAIKDIADVLIELNEQGNQISNLTNKQGADAPNKEQK
ncbi:ABC transporter transmembrane domain-containing protein [Colwelliaceae bacterium BS250]